MSDLAYVNARLRGRKAKLFSRAALEELLALPEPDLVTDRLLESPYGMDLAEALRSYPPLRAVDEAFAANLHRSLHAVLTMAGDEAGQSIRALTENWDVQCLKAIFRGLQAQKPPHDILAEVGPGAQLERHHIEDLAKSADVRTAVEQLLAWSMPWATVLLPLLGPYRTHKDLLPLESALDHFRYRYLNKTDSDSMLRDKMAVTLLVTEWEVVNILLCLMFLEQEDDPPLLLIPGRTSRVINALRKAKTQEEAIDILARSPFRTVLDEALPFMGESGRFAILERLMDDELLRQSKRQALLEPLSVAVPCHYLRCKLNETRNLRLIARGVSAHVSPNVIKPGLVLWPAA